MPKTRSDITLNPKASFYALMYPMFRKVALDCGYSLAIHGSMINDFDLIAVPWIKEPAEVEELVQRISDCLGDTVWSEYHLTDKEDKPHNRIAYNLSISGDWRIDLSIIKPIKN